MFLNYLKTAFRFFARNKGFIIINILGLSMGIAVSIIGFLYVIHELGYDRFNRDADRIYRIAVDALVGNTAIYQTFTPAPMARALYDEFPGIEAVTRISSWDDLQFEYKDKTFIEDNVFVTDSTFFDMFTLPVISGIKDKLLNQPYTAVLTESTAKRYFGEEDPINKVIRTDTLSFKVISVVADVPANSHFHFDMALALISFDGYYNNPEWFANNFRTYFILFRNSDIKKVEEKLPDFTDKYLFGGKYAEHAGEGNKWELYLQPLLSIHLNSDIRGEFEPNGRKEYVYIFLVVSIIILVIACINFINLSTAKAAGRAREVGIRKTLGAQRNQLMQQYLGESLLTSFISLIVAVGFAEIALAYLRQHEDLHLDIPYFGSYYTIPLLLLLGLLVGIVSGSYPSMVLSSFRPIRVLRSHTGQNSRSPWLRNVLVTFQFVISVFLIIGTFIIYNQLDLLQNRNLGFTKENVICIQNPSVLTNSIESFKNDLHRLPFVEHVSSVFRLPGERFVNLGFGGEGIEGGFSLNLTLGDEETDDVLQLELLEGRFFSKEFGTDTTAIVINEQAAKLLAYDKPLGKTLNTWGDPQLYFHIIGIVRDVYYESKHQKVHPMGIVHIRCPLEITPGTIAVRITSGNYSDMITGIRQVWDSYSPSIPFEYSFLDRQYDQLYRNEEQTRKLFLAFSFLAIFIACMGLLGLVTFIAHQKIKEIGIRKVFGATSFSISVLLSRYLTKWILLANIIAWPLSWYFFDRWLNHFAYRTSIEWWYFLLAGLLSLFIALVTLSYQTVKSAFMNPEEALKYE
ncbi:MAG: ABC transporter permease [Bacteroidales bacterium]|nr:ABC transporter permease [Bacteroidales bacterium]